MQTERSGTQGPLHTCTQNHVRLDHVTTVCGFGLVRIANARVKTSDVHACTGFSSMATWMRGVLRLAVAKQRRGRPPHTRTWAHRPRRCCYWWPQPVQRIYLQCALQLVIYTCIYLCTLMIDELIAFGISTFLDDILCTILSMTSEFLS
jgi:hypothetical protein